MPPQHTTRVSIATAAHASEGRTTARTDCSSFKQPSPAQALVCQVDAVLVTYSSLRGHMLAQRGAVVCANDSDQPSLAVLSLTT